MYTTGVREASRTEEHTVSPAKRGSARPGRRPATATAAKSRPAKSRPSAPAPAPAPAPVELPAIPAAAAPIVVTAPELVFAERVPAPEPRPRPAVRRGIFFDVENSSRPEHVAAVLRYLRIDWTTHATELIAVGNWRVASPETARLLAEQGAQLVHSAPATGVRDWSDLRIAVGAGAWLASARPGDIIELITDDQAFDAVGDAAAALGVVYRRLSYRQLSGMGELPVDAPRASSDSSGGRRGRRRGGRRGRPDGRQDAHGARPHARPSGGSHRPPAPAHAAPPPPPAAAGTDEEGHTAPADEIRGLLHELLESSPSGVTLDALANALKSRGFRRTPGSPRLITRLKNLKGVEVTRAGVVRLINGGSAPPVETAPSSLLHPPAQLAGMPEEDDDLAEVPVNPARVVRAEVVADDEDESQPGPGNEREPAASTPSAEAGAEADRRRRRRRGGRRWRGRRGRGGEGGSTPAVQQAS